MNTCSVSKNKYNLNEVYKNLGIVLDQCSSWKTLENEKPRFIGSGSYGVVYSMVLNHKGRKKDVAVKTIYMDNSDSLLKEETEREIRYAKLMAKAHIGPKIYDEFIYQLNNESNIIIIIMERFERSGSSALNTGKITKTQKKIIIKKMINLMKHMISKKMYCFDIKPGNFVVNIKKNKITVRMIDFGGQFCSYGRDIMKEWIHTLQSESEKMLQNDEFNEIKSELKIISKADVKFFDKLFFTIIMMPFGVMVGKALPSSSSPEILTVFHSFLHSLCNNETAEIAVALLLSRSSRIFKTFYHYTSSWNEPVDRRPHNYKEVHKYIGTLLDKMCVRYRKGSRKSYQARFQKLMGYSPFL